jgi:diguanylate cyclase (GGDEF)-like protein/PAS domain S-box-containing protein
MNKKEENIPEVRTAFLQHNLRSDKTMLYLIALHWFIGAAITSVEYETYQIGFLSGGLYFLIILLSYIFFRGQKEFRILVGIVLMLFTMLYIQQSLGRIEMHFHIFIAISFLTLYKDSYAVVSALITTIIHHMLFNYMQEHQMMLFGEPVYIFNYGCGYDIVLLHIIFVVFESLVIFYFIKISKEDFIHLILAKKNYQDMAENLETAVETRTKELRKLNTVFEEAQQITHLGNWEWNISEGSLKWSDEIYRIFGLKPKSILPTYNKFTSFVHPEDRTYVTENIDLALKNNIPYDVVHRIIDHNNMLKHVHQRAHIDRDQKGNPIRMLGTVQDITRETHIQSELRKSEDKFKILTENSYTGILMHNDSILYANPKFIEMTGYSQHEFSSTNLTDIFSTTNNDFINTLHQDLKEEKSIKQYDDIQMNCKDGSTKLVSVFSMTIEYEGKLVFLSNIFDISDIRKAEEQIKMLSQIVEQTDDLIKMTDNKGRITYVNDAVVKQSGYTRQEILGKTPSLFKSNMHSDDFYKELWDTITQKLPYKNVLINRKKDGSIYYEAETITPIINNNNNEITGYVSTGKDITERIQLENKLSKLASKDALTGLCNRRKLEETLAAEITRAIRYESPMSLIMFDIDHFKSINDRFGHDVGDDILRSFAKVIQDNIRKTDISARWGGEEFIILSPETTEENAENLAEKLRCAIENYDFDLPVKITASFGVTQYIHGETSEQMIKRADKAMYQAKENGRNRVVKS